jgi:hypothetical protein
MRVQVQVEEGRLVLGRFQRIIFFELDGPRPRSLRMQFMGDGVAHRVDSVFDVNGRHNGQLSRDGGLR